MVPLKITFTFGSPVVVDSEYPIHLDALLAWARVQENIALGMANAWQFGDDLPLARAGEGTDWVWQASRLLFTPKMGRQIVNMLRESSPEQFYADFDEELWCNDKCPGKAGKGRKKPPVIQTRSGQYRAYMYYVSTQWMERAEAWCVGDPARVREMLNRIESVGKMGRNGFGIIASVNVEEDQAAIELWRLRVLPEGIDRLHGTEYAPVMSPPRAPYWDKLARVPMCEPISWDVSPQKNY